jgi:hypothetical protein
MHGLYWLVANLAGPAALALPVITFAQPQDRA